MPKMAWRTDRAEFLEFFYQDTLYAAMRRSLSTVRLGRWRLFLNRT